MTEVAQTLSSIKSKSFSGAVSYFLRTLLTQGIAFYAMVVLSRYFSPEDFGVYGIVQQIIGVLVFFSDIGLAAALIQKKHAPSLADYRTAFTIQLLLSFAIIAMSVAVLATGWLQAKTGPAGVWILLALAVSFPLATLKTIPSIMLERELHLSRLVIPLIFEQLVYYGILVVMAWQGMGAIAYAYAVIARSITGVLVMSILQRWSIGFALNRDSIKELFNFGAKFQLNDLLARVKDQLFFLVLAQYLPLNQFGYIQWAKQWSMQPYMLTVQNVMAVTFPTFSRLQEHTTALKRAIEKSLFFITAVMFPMLVGMSVFIIPLLDLFPEYAKWQPAVISLIFFNLSIAWSAISTPLTNTLNALGYVGTTLKLMVLWTTLTWLVLPLGVVLFDFHGIAIGAFAIGFTSLLPAYYVKQHVPISVLDQIWRQLVAAVVMAVISILGLSFWNNSVWHLILGMGISTLSYVAILLLIGKTKFMQELKSLPVKIPFIRYV